MRANKLVILSFGMCFPDHEFLGLDERSLLISAEDFSLLSDLEPTNQLFHAAALRNHVHGLVTSARVQHHPFSPFSPPELRSIILNLLRDSNINEITTYENLHPSILSWLQQVCPHRGVQLRIVQSPGYLNSSSELVDILERKLFSLQSFYWHQRKRLRILLDDTGEPIESEVEHGLDIQPSFDPQNFCITHSRYTLDLADSLQGFDPYFKQVFLNLELASSRKEALRHSEHILRSLPQSGSNGRLVFAAMKKDFCPINQYLEAGLVLPMEIVRKAVLYKMRYRLSFSHVEHIVRHIIGHREFNRLIPLSSRIPS